MGSFISRTPKEASAPSCGAEGNALSCGASVDSQRHTAQSDGQQALQWNDRKATTTSNSEIWLVSPEKEVCGIAANEVGVGDVPKKILADAIRNQASVQICKESVELDRSDKPFHWGSLGTFNSFGASAVQAFLADLPSRLPLAPTAEGFSQFEADCIAVSSYQGSTQPRVYGYIPEHLENGVGFVAVMKDSKDEMHFIFEVRTKTGS